jgi:hypothetical protein
MVKDSYRFRKTRNSLKRITRSRGATRTDINDKDRRAPRQRAQPSLRVNLILITSPAASAVFFLSRFRATTDRLHPGNHPLHSNRIHAQLEELGKRLTKENKSLKAGVGAFEILVIARSGPKSAARDARRSQGRYGMDSVL